MKERNICCSLIHFKLVHVAEKFSVLMIVFTKINIDFILKLSVISSHTKDAAADKDVDPFKSPSVITGRLRGLKNY